MSHARLLSRTPHAASLQARAGAVAKMAAAALLMSITAVLMLLVGAVTWFQERRLYSFMAMWLCRAVLEIYRIRIEFIGAERIPPTQVVYVSNHTSTLDMFVLAALGLPHTRFFLTGSLRRILPLGVITTMMGTFFTVPQDRQAERRRIFQRATEILRRTGESVYLSPEGGRIITGEIGHFNKGAFHLATELKAPIVPMHFEIPPHVDPGLSHDARPGTVRVHVLPPVDTRQWKVEDLMANVTLVRDLFVDVHRGLRCS